MSELDTEQRAFRNINEYLAAQYKRLHEKALTALLPHREFLCEYASYMQTARIESLVSKFIEAATCDGSKEVVVDINFDRPKYARKGSPRSILSATVKVVVKGSNYQGSSGFFFVGKYGAIRAGGHSNTLGGMDISF